MNSAEACVKVDRPRRYLEQLCKHANAVDSILDSSGMHHRHRAHPGAAEPDDAGVQVSAEWTQDAGVLTFSTWGQCGMHASADVLALRIDADGEASLSRIQDVVTRDLERFGRRDHLHVTWHPA